MNRALRYQISDWSQITQCLSNNSRNLNLSLSKYRDKGVLEGLLIQVNHANYGVLFAAMIKGKGSLLSLKDESGLPIPFMTTDQILKELQRYGFYIKYDLKSNLPNNVLDYLCTIDNLGFDKITKIGLEKRFVNGCTHYVDTTIVFKSQYNPDLLTYGCHVSKHDFNKKLADNTIMNVSNEPELVWDWVTSMLGIEDVLNENVDPVNLFETDTGLKCTYLTINPSMCNNLDENGLPIPEHVCSDGGQL